METETGTGARRSGRRGGTLRKLAARQIPSSQGFKGRGMTKQYNYVGKIQKEKTIIQSEEKNVTWELSRYNLPLGPFLIDRGLGWGEAGNSRSEPEPCAGILNCIS